MFGAIWSPPPGPPTQRDVVALLRLEIDAERALVALGDVAAAVDVRAPVRRVADVDAPAVVVEGDVVLEDVARLRRLDAHADVGVGRVPLDQRALAGRRLVADVDPAAVVVARVLARSDVAEGLRLERDAGRVGLAGVVALDQVAGRLLQRDAALVAADVVPADDVVVREEELDRVGVASASPTLSISSLPLERSISRAGPSSVGDQVALDEVAGGLDAGRARSSSRR